MYILAGAALHPWNTSESYKDTRMVIIPGAKHAAKYCTNVQALRPKSCELAQIDTVNER